MPNQVQGDAGGEAAGGAERAAGGEEEPKKKGKKVRVLVLLRDLLLARNVVFVRVCARRRKLKPRRRE